MEQPNFSSTWTPEHLTNSVTPSVLLGFCFLVGVPGNIMVIKMILHHFKRDNFTVKLMLNLAVSDVLCLISLPVWIYALLCGWDFGNTICKLMSYMIYCSLYSSLLTITLMSVQRYVQVVHTRYWQKLGGTGERVLLGLLWVAACVLALYSMVLANVTLRGKMLHCEFEYVSETQKVAVLLAETFFGFVVPFPVMVTSYYWLHKKVTRATFFSNQRLTRLAISIVVTFSIFWIPLHVVHLIKLFSVFLRESDLAASIKLDNFCFLANNIVGSLSFINSCMNPFLYAFASRNLRQDVVSFRKTEDVSTSNL